MPDKLLEVSKDLCIILPKVDQRVKRRPILIYEPAGPIDEESHRNIVEAI